jgi:hypothetical protein
MQRRGVASDGVPLTIASSTIIGSKTPVVSGEFGPIRTVGVEVTGAMPAKARFELRTSTVMGGDVRDICADYRCGSNGVAISAPIDSAIEGNALIRGSFASSGYGAVGVRITNASSHSIRGNALIAAGNVIGSDTIPSAAVAVVGSDTAPATIAVEENTLLAGTPDPAWSAPRPTGFYGRNVVATIRHNGRIAGGNGPYPVGVLVERGKTPNVLTILDNVIDSGSNHGDGLDIAGASGRVERNVINGCQLPDKNGSPNPRCFAATSSTVGSQGLIVDWDYGTVVANNFIFARQTACRLGFSPPDWKAPLAVTFSGNTCIALGPSASDRDPVVALELAPGFTGSPFIGNNVLDGKTIGFLHDSSYQNAKPKETYTFVSNALVPRGQACQAQVYLPPNICFANATALNAQNNPSQVIAGNVSIDPRYADPSGPLSPASFRLDASCSLRRMGRPVSSVPKDFEQALRSATAPTIGPNECR